MEITKHFTATTIIVHKQKVLLHLHKKLGIWIPVGGHIDRDELPENAALRELNYPADGAAGISDHHPTHGVKEA